jgi:hypothetical protein
MRTRTISLAGATAAVLVALGVLLASVRVAPPAPATDAARSARIDLPARTHARPPEPQRKPGARAQALMRHQPTDMPAGPERPAWSRPLRLTTPRDAPAAPLTTAPPR